jgi:thymidylate synthase
MRFSSKKRNFHFLLKPERSIERNLDEIKFIQKKWVRGDEITDSDILSYYDSRQILYQHGVTGLNCLYYVGKVKDNERKSFLKSKRRFRRRSREAGNQIKAIIEGLRFNPEDIMRECLLIKASRMN